MLRLNRCIPLRFAIKLAFSNALVIMETKPYSSFQYSERYYLRDIMADRPDMLTPLIMMLISEI